MLSIICTKHTNIFEWFSKLGELVEALLYNIGGPLVNFIVLVGISPDGPFHSFLDDIGHFIHNKCSLIKSNKIIDFTVYLKSAKFSVKVRKNSQKI